MADWTNDALGARGRIAATTDRRRALDGADFAINMIQVGGHAATRLDFEIPAKYGSARPSPTLRGSVPCSAPCAPSP